MTKEASPPPLLPDVSDGDQGPPDFQSAPHWARGAVPAAEVGPAKRPWQRARWQPAIFLKVDNKTSCEPSEEATKAAGVEESRRAPGAGKALLQSSAFLAGTDPVRGSPFLNWPFLERRWRSDYTRTGLTDACYQELLALPG